MRLDPVPLERIRGAKTPGSKSQLTRAQRRQILVLRSQGHTQEAISVAVGCSSRTVFRVLKKTDLVTTQQAAQVVGITRSQMREEQKEILLRKFREATEHACEWALRQMEAGDPKAFLQIIQGIEKMNVISGHAAGEAMGGGGSAPPVTHVDIKILLGQILGKPAAIDVTNGDGPRS